MGLDTTHGCWHGAYSAFHHWRQKIAELEGYAVWPVQMAMDCVTVGLRDTIMLDWGHISEANLMGEWDDVFWTMVPPSFFPEKGKEAYSGTHAYDPLIIIFAHHDDRGKILAKFCWRIAARLREVLPKLRELPDATGHIGNWEEKTLKFIVGLEKACAAKEDVLFH